MVIGRSVENGNTVEMSRSAAADKKDQLRHGPRGSDDVPLNRKEKLDRTRIAILESALKHFSELGFEGASVRTIAAEAGVNHAMIRHIYGSKNELWRHAITFLFERIGAELAQNAEEFAGLSDRERLKVQIRRYVAYCARHPEHARIMVQQSILAGPELTWAAEHFILSRHQRDLPFLEHLQKTGDLPKVDTLALHFVIIGACQMIYLLAPEVRAVDGRDVFDPEEIRKHADAVIGLLFRDS